MLCKFVCNHDKISSKSAKKRVKFAKLLWREPSPEKSDSLLFTLSFVELALPTQHELPLVVMFFHGNYSFVWIYWSEPALSGIRWYFANCSSNSHGSMFLFVLRVNLLQPWVSSLSIENAYPTTQRAQNSKRRYAGNCRACLRWMSPGKKSSCDW